MNQIEQAQPQLKSQQQGATQAAKQVTLLAPLLLVRSVLRFLAAFFQYFLPSHRLRTRLILAYAGLIVAGFSVFALLVGQQTYSSAYLDFRQRVLSEILLVGEGLKQPVSSFVEGKLSSPELVTVMRSYENQIGGELVLHTMKDNRQVSLSTVLGSGSMASDNGEPGPEIAEAARGRVILDQRIDVDGQDKIFTAVPVVVNHELLAYVQLRVPCSSINSVLFERWGRLALVVLGITSLALLVGFWLSSSLTRPLDRLRVSALEISKGNLSHRVEDSSSDEIGEVAKAFNLMATQIQSMIDEHRAFASNASHELKTPLTTIRLRTEALRNDADLSNDLKDRYIAEIDDEAIRLSSLLEDLILLSRFDAGRVTTGQDRIELRRFARNMYHQLQEQAQRKNIDFQLTVGGEDEVFLEANLNHLSILFRNLLDNAFKYTSNGGRVSWCITSHEEQLEITIRDSGQGIAAQDLPRIFERFYRADKSHSRTIPGSGLGLPLVQAITTTYGAAINIHSPGEGQGTTVKIEWPIRAEVLNTY